MRVTFLLKGDDDGKLEAISPVEKTNECECVSFLSFVHVVLKLVWINKTRGVGIALAYDVKPRPLATPRVVSNNSATSVTKYLLPFVVVFV